MLEMTEFTWHATTGALVEVTVVPDDLPEATPLAFETPGLALVQHARGGVSIGGIAGPSLVLLEQCDRVVHLPPGEVSLELAVQAAADQLVRFRAVVSIADPERFVAAVVHDDFGLTEDELSRLLSRDGAVRLAMQRAMFEPHGIDATALAAALTDPLAQLFGLTLREILPGVTVVDARQQSAKLRVGDVVAERWELIERLGHGAAGDVWRVRDRRRPTAERALKVMHDPLTASYVDREARRILQLERRGIDFRHIAKLIDIVSLESPALLYEYVPGVTLREFVEDCGGCLPDAVAIDITRQLLDGLAEIHRAGVVHRDLHPSNVMVHERSGKRDVKILDLGMAVATSVDAPQANGRYSVVSRRLRPTHAYAEVGAAVTDDSRTDLYSAAVLLWWMLSGQVGLPAGRRLDDVLPDASQTVRTVVTQAALLPREQRYASAGEMRAALAPPRRLRRRRAEVATRTTSRAAQRRPHLRRLSTVAKFLALFLMSVLLLGGGLLLGMTRGGAALARGVVVVAGLVVAVPLVLFAFTLALLWLLVFT